MNHHHRNCTGVNSGSLFWGIVLIGIGTIVLFDRFTDSHHYIREYWPLFLIAMGIARLPQRGHVWSGLSLIGIGAWLQLTILHVAGMTFRNSWPLIVIFFGASMVLQTIVNSLSSRDHSAKDAQESEVRHDV